MASRFVSTGAIDPTSGLHVEAEAAPDAGAAGAQGVKGNKEAWEAVQKEVAEERRRRAAEKASGEPGKSLYDVLQENKGNPLTPHPLTIPTREPIPSLRPTPLLFLPRYERRRGAD